LHEDGLIFVTNVKGAFDFDAEEQGESNGAIQSA
jgi:hypothetical protein